MVFFRDLNHFNFLLLVKLFDFKVEGTNVSFNVPIDENGPQVHFVPGCCFNFISRSILLVLNGVIALVRTDVFISGWLINFNFMTDVCNRFYWKIIIDSENSENLSDKKMGFARIFIRINFVTYIRIFVCMIYEVKVYY